MVIFRHKSLTQYLVFMHLKMHRGCVRLHEDTVEPSLAKGNMWIIHSPLPKLCPPTRWHAGLCLIHPSAVKIAITNLTSERSKKARLFLPYLQSLPLLCRCIELRNSRLKSVKSRLEIPLGFRAGVSKRSTSAKKI